MLLYMGCTQRKGRKRQIHDTTSSLGNPVAGSGVLCSSPLTYSIAINLLRTRRWENIFILITILMFIAEPFSDCKSQLDKHLLFTGLRSWGERRAKNWAQGNCWRRENAAAIPMGWEDERHSRGRLVSLCVPSNARQRNGSFQLPVEIAESKRNR